MKLQFKPNKLGVALIIVAIAAMLTLGYIKRKKIKSVAKQTINYLLMETWDIITDKRINTLHPIIRGKVKEFIIRAEKELGIKLRVTWGLRTWKEQEKLYNQPFDHIDNDRDGLTDEADEKVTFAKPGQSYHNYGLAFDVVEMKNGKPVWKNPNWKKIAQLGESLGFEWGGRWKKPDRPHFQMRFGKHHTELAELYRSGQRNGEYVKLAA